MVFDRTVSDELVRLLTKTHAKELVARAGRSKDSPRPLYDLQLRANAHPVKGTSKYWATLYYGMTKLIDLEVNLKGQWRLNAHANYRKLKEFDVRWTSWQDGKIDTAWPAVRRYLQAMESEGSPVADKHLRNEGPVHAAISSGNSDAYRIINRECSPSFVDEPTLSRRRDEWIKPFHRAFARRRSPESWWPTDKTKVGTSPDFLAVDIGGRLAVIEAKSDGATASELTKVPVQVGVYAAMYADLLRENRDQPNALDAIAAMLGQRTELGLSRKGVLHLRDARRVVPVVAIGPADPKGTFPGRLLGREGRDRDRVHRRMWTVAKAVQRVNDDRAVDPVEVWYLDRQGRIAEVERLEDVEAAGLA